MKKITLSTTMGAGIAIDRYAVGSLAREMMSSLEWLAIGHRRRRQ